MIVKSWLPERRELLTPNLHWLISLGEQNAIERALQSPNPSAQGRGAPNSKADKQMNMIRHDHVSADANAKLGGPTTKLDERLVHFRRGEQRSASVRVESDEVDRCVGGLKE